MDEGICQCYTPWPEDSFCVVCGLEVEGAETWA